MEEEQEPEPPHPDGAVRYALKLKVNTSPEKTIRLAPKFERGTTKLKELEF
jgi:hypothetical protein